MGWDTTYVVQVKWEGEEELHTLMETTDYGFAATELDRQEKERNLVKGYIVEVKRRIVREVRKE